MNRNIFPLPIAEESLRPPGLPGERSKLPLMGVLDCLRSLRRGGVSVPPERPPACLLPLHFGTFLVFSLLLDL